MSTPPNRPRTLPGLRSGGQDWLLVYAVATAMTLAVLTWIAALASGIFSHGRPATVPWNAAGAALPHLLAHPGNPAAAYTTAGGHGVGGPAAFWSCFAVLATAAATGGYAAGRRLRRWRRSGQDGLATRADLTRALSAKRALGKAPTLRPSLAGASNVAVTDVAVSCGTALEGRVPLWVPCEDSLAVIAPARAGKTSQLIVQQVLDWPGAALVTSARTDVLYGTALLRQDNGPVRALDPYGLAGWPDQVRWSLTDGCADFGVAQRRADVLTTTARSEQGTRNGGYFVNNAKILLTCWLHAAALGGYGGAEVLRWASSPTTRDPITLLAERGRQDLSRTLATLYEGDDEEKRSSWKTAFQPLAGLLNPSVAEVFACDPAASIDLDQWLTSGGTIYLIGEEDDASLLSPLLAAFGRAVMHTAQRRAARSPGGRLDPPLALFGDEIANCIPLPDLPKLMSTAGGFGIFVLASLQNLAQAEQRWGPLGIRQILSNATVKVVLGGISDPIELKAFADAIGEYDEQQMAVTEDERRVSLNTSTRRRAILDPGMIRTVPEHTGVMIYRSIPAARVRFVPAHQGRRAAEIADATHRALALVNPPDARQGKP